jgi:hypothetical protein
MKRFDVKSVLAGAVIGAGSILALAATGSQRTAFEYAVVPGIVHSGELQTKMNNYSAGEWEFLATETIGDRYGYAIFRRPKP